MKILHRNCYDALPLLLILLCPGTSATDAGDPDAPAANYEVNLEAQWQKWPYFDESIKWHTDWTRWDASTAAVNDHFRAYRDLGPSPDDTKKFSSIHTNTYFYEDQRGTVANCGPMCGPWELDKEDPQYSSPYGIIHPSRDFMRTILFPDRSLVWIPKELPTFNTSTSEFSDPAGFELFLGDGEFLRVSIGISYDKTGQLVQVSALREDARDFGLFWSGTDGTPTDGTPTLAPELKKYTTVQEKQSVLEDSWFADVPDYGSKDGLQISVPELEQSRVLEADPSSLWLGYDTSLDTLLPWDDITVYEVPDDGIVMVCPNQLPKTDEDWFEVAVAWKKADGTWAAALQAVYENGTMNHVDYVTMDNNDSTSSAPVDTESADTVNDSASPHNTLERWHGILVVISMVAVSFSA